MSDRRTPDDLLANILSGKKSSKDNTPAQPPVAATPPPAVVVEPSKEDPIGEKVKATYYLPEDTTGDVEKIWMQARQMVPKAKRSAMSKSYIVEIAIALLLEEFEAHGSNSRLFQKLEP